MFASYLETTFSTDEERVKALYIWLAKEIDYTVRKVNSPIRIESLSELVNATLNTHRAVCQGNFQEKTTSATAIALKFTSINRSEEKQLH
ncbi:MAG: hypothetical protein ISS19_05435 [Bacteroidales bacterium]|nr:hypothetical protein [Bacteroidales bacterium]